MISNIKSVIRDASIVYGLTFAFALGSAIAGFTMQNSPSTTYLTNLVSGAAGFAMAGIRISTNRAEHVAWVAVTFWTFNLTNIVLGFQTYAAWIHSGITIILMVVLGGILASILYPLSKSTRPYCRPPQTE
ncbi:MAG: hypothetical protein HY348_06860 [Nitrospira defluvii]|nr:hypothetical protein [Nitrospira defluvii]